MKTTGFVLLTIDTPQPGAVVRSGTQIHGNGWVIAEREVLEIAIYLGETFLCQAAYGIERRDIVEKFPHFKQASHAGFTFSAFVPPLPDGPIPLIVKVRTIDGGQTHRRVRLIAGEPGAPITMAPAPPPPGIRIFVDSAVVDQRGLLRVKGWVLSLTPLQEFNLFIGEQQLAAPEVGIERLDVGRNFPLYPNALSAGFLLVQDVGELAQTSPTIRILALAEGGVRRHLIAPIELPPNYAGRAGTPDDLIDIFCDTFALWSDGTVAVEGWAIAAQEIDTISVLLDGIPLGEAERGLLRPDVGNRFPQIINSRRAGFRFTHRVPNTLSGEHQLAVRARTYTGRERVMPLPVQVTESAVGPSILYPLADAPNPIQYSIDLPRLDGDEAAEPLRGALTVSGWAIVAGGLASVDVRIDGRTFGPAYVGVRREDLAAAFPDNEDALLSGFAQTIPHKLIGEGDHGVEVIIRGKNGASVERAFSLISEAPAEIAATALRARIPQAEVDLKRAILDRQKYHPVFLVVVVVPAGSLGNVSSTLTTIESLQRQEYTSWHAFLVVSSADDMHQATSNLPNGRAGWAAQLEVGTFPGLQNSMHERLQQQNAFLVVLHSGDRLGADCFLEMAVHAAVDPGADFIYADERRHDPALGVTQAWMKPDWAPDLLLSTNYIGRPWCASSALVTEVRLSLTQIGDLGVYDCVLRLTEAARRVDHIPRILCERAGVFEDTKATERRALANAMQRRGTAAKILNGLTPGTWRIKRAVPTAKKVSLIMPTCAAGDLIKVGIASIRDKTAYRNFEIVVIDNIPTTLPEAKQWVRKNADRVLEIHEAFSWSRFNNRGAAVADGDFLLFINDDVEAIEPNWLDAMIEHAQRPEVGVVGAQLLYPDRKVQHAGLFLDGVHGRHAFRFAPHDEPGSFGLALTQRNMIAVTGACLLVRRDHFEALNGFDEVHKVINNDLDFCLRTWRAGKRVVFTPFATLIHHELASRAKLKDDYDESQFSQSWGSLMASGDPFHHPLLSASADGYIQEPEPVETLYAGNPIIAKERVRTILAIKVDHIGDFVIALPVFARIKRHFPEARLIVLAAKASVSLARLEPAIDEVIEFNFFNARSSLGQHALDEPALAALATRLAPYDFDLAIDLRTQPDTRHLLQRSGATVLAGYDTRGRFPWLDITLEWDGDQHLVPKRAHATNKLMQLVEAVAVMCDRDRSSRGDLSCEAAIAKLPELPALVDVSKDFFDRPLLCIHPGAGSEMKEWPARSYADLINMFVTRESMHAVLIGGQDEMAAVEEIRRHLVRPGTMISLVNAVSLRDLPILLQACRLFVGNDSGPKHMAAALGVPTLGIHSSNIDAAEWAPLGPSAAAVRRRMSCGPCYISVPSDCHRQLACIRGIRASDVYRAARLLLATAMPTTVLAKGDPDARVDVPTFAVPVQLDSKRPRRLDAVETDRSTRRRSRRA